MERLALGSGLGGSGIVMSYVIRWNHPADDRQLQQVVGRANIA